MKAFVFSLVCVSFAVAQEPKPAQPVADKWEKEIAGIEKKLKETPPKKGGVFFAGSSSIRLWKLDKSFPEAGYVNVGFGGSHIKDSTQYADRILLPFEPSTILFYAGDNDIGAKRTPEQVRDDFQAFVKVIHDKLPKTKILYFAIKPSPKRWAMYDQQVKANGYIKEVIAKDPRLVYLDTVTIMLDKDGKPVQELFVKDDLHMSEKGYELWTELVKKNLK